MLLPEVRVSKTSVPPGMVKSTALANRRAKIRYRCAPATIGRVLSTEDQEIQIACILDLSLCGIGMQLVRRIEPGRIVIISMKSNDGTRVFELPARVTYCKAVPHNEWTVGCELTRILTPDELEQLL